MILRTFINVPRDIVIYEKKKVTILPNLIVLAGFGQWFVTGYMSFVMSQHMPAFFSWIPKDEYVLEE